MVRTRGLDFTIKVNASMGSRIRDLKVRGKPMEPHKDYTMSGWASMAAQPGPPVFDVVIDYIKRKKNINVFNDRPKLVI